MLTASRITVSEGTQAYAKLRSEVIAAGIFERAYVYYAVVITAVVVGFFGSLYAIYRLENYALLTLACLAFSFFTVQAAGINHDAGHRAVFKSNRNNNVLGLFTSMLVGIVFDNWRTRHNAHHAFSNQVGTDPDLEIPFIATDEAMVASKSALQRFLVRYQAFYYYPLGSIVSFSNRLGTLSYFIRRRSIGDWGRFLLYLPPLITLFILPFVLFSPGKALFVFSLVHVTSGIYLATCFAPNHKGMPVVGENTAMSLIEQQVVTSRNVSGGILTDIMLVGLNWQTEHHLFPATPRNKLHLIAPYLQSACAELGLTYTSTSFVETNKDIVRQLYRVQRYASAPKARPQIEPTLVASGTAGEGS
ncbi:MAG TPA: acyl-CoA desaturase [Dehalococcoidia bacterium]|nr:acyl-CoA desaturase [Dehalococcoidia bacterium]